VTKEIAGWKFLEPSVFPNKAAIKHPFVSGTNGKIFGVAKLIT
jgi:hypothetical protein